MSDVLKSRFVVKRCEIEKIVGYQTVNAFLVPLMPDYGGEEDNAVDDLIFDVQARAIPSDIGFSHMTDAKTSESHESGIWLTVPEEIALGTVVDIELHVVGVVA